MRSLTLTWRYLIIQPATQVFYCLFQPARFANELEPGEFAKRINSMFRFVLLLFIIDYPLALVLQIIIYNVIIHQKIRVALADFLITTVWTTALGIGWGIVCGAIGNIRLGLALGVALGITGGLLITAPLGTVSGITVAVALSLLGGIIGGNIWGIPGGIIAGIVGGAAPIIAGNTKDHVGMFEIAFTFFFVYLIGYYRLLLYPVSALSLLRTYMQSRKMPKNVFTYLHHSSLYWDERIFLPLPRLAATLHVAVRENSALAINEIVFIVTQRPQQIGAARFALLEIAIHELEVCNTLKDIAEASYRLAEILSEEVRQIVPQWTTTFAHFSDASFDAARYCSPLDRPSRRKALEDMIDNLNKINLNIAFGEARLLQRMRTASDKWLKVAQDEQAQLTHIPLEIGQIDNPFSPGEANEQSPFVGRRDLVYIVENSLRKKGSHPTFFLNGERRMGKSSTLKQLPRLLGARYIPITYDLLKPGICSSTAAFLGSIAKEINKVLQVRGIAVKQLDIASLSDFGRDNEAAIYLPFNAWIEDLVRTLEQYDRLLLLAFDEFEKLEETQQTKLMKVPLLLDWFRYTIEHHPRLALLFSGVRSIGEMGLETNTNWSTYFVNAQVLRISFLQPDEAYQLIIDPQEGFPGRQVFGEDVTQEIIRITGCHPFLIQAICSKLIEHLNANRLDHAEFQHVEIATQKVMENWWDTYFRDLWQRTEKEQRICLFALERMGGGIFQQIAEQSNLDAFTLRQTLQTLQKRDLIMNIGDHYQITTPIFSKWVERNR